MTELIEQCDAADLCVQELTACADLTTLIGEVIRPDEWHQGDGPRGIRYETLSNDEEMHLGGSSQTATSRIQFDCCGESRRVANRIARYLHAVLIALSGRVFTIGAGADAITVKFFDVVRDTNYSRKDPGPPGANKPRYRRVQDYVITHDEPLPTLSDPSEE